ncbi:MAG: hypothetical protein P1U53_00160 [Sulfitobacter sp.]|nr:hypothetical protein [Sulfitobacter sp.]
MIGRLSGAATRGFLVALLIAMPALMVPGVHSDSSQIVVLLALLGGILTLVEYNSNFPSIVEFRDAPPFNRLRFLALFLPVFLLSALFAHDAAPTGLTSATTSLGTILGRILDFPYSPVRLIVLAMPLDAPDHLVALVRAAASISLALALICSTLFALCVKFRNWPTRTGAFNVWVNLPLFDPTAGRDVVYRLERDARVHLFLGFLLPFLIPALIKLFSLVFNAATLTETQTVIWTLSAWAFLPTTMFMRGLAMAKVASLIADKRRRASRDAEAEGELQPA